MEPGLDSRADRLRPDIRHLATVAWAESIILTIFVLITENRMQAEVEKWPELDVQISLLEEHEVTRLVRLLDGVARTSAWTPTTPRLPRPSETLTRGVLKDLDQGHANGVDSRAGLRR